jgi:hypothetical protein
LAGCLWLTLIILATQETESMRIAVWSQLGQVVHETLSRKNPSPKRAGTEWQGVGPYFKPPYSKKKKKKKSKIKKVTYPYTIITLVLPIRNIVLGAGTISYWSNACVACVEPWVWFPHVVLGLCRLKLMNMFS